MLFMGTDYDWGKTDFSVYPYSYWKPKGSPNNEMFFQMDDPSTKLGPVYLSEICSNLFRRVHDDIRRWTEKKRNYKVVVSIPAGYGYPQKDAIKAAARHARLQVIAFVTVTDACILSYAFNSPSDMFLRKRNKAPTLVLNLGATTFNLGLYEVIDRNDIRRIGEFCDVNFGGFEFDTELLKYVCEILENDENIVPPVVRNRAFMRKLRKECERVKTVLSTYSDTVFSIDLVGFGNYETSITIKNFENITEKLCVRAMDIIKHFMRRFQTSSNFIGDVVLCGGSTGIPQLQQRLAEEFLRYDKSPFIAWVHRDESVVQGAALRAAVLSSLNSQAGVSIQFQ